MRAEGVVVRLSKWMRELESAFYGSSAAYDAALAATKAGIPPGVGDALAGALRRNVFMCEEGSGPMPPGAVQLARYVRHQLACLAMTERGDVLGGHISYAVTAQGGKEVGARAASGGVLGREPGAGGRN